MYWLVFALMLSGVLAQDTRNFNGSPNIEIRKLLALDEHNLLLQRRIAELESTTTQQGAENNILEERIATLEGTTTQQGAENNILEERIATLEGATTEAIAFFAYPSSTRTYRENDTVIFDRVLTNLGDGYSMDTNHFKCPLKGLYLFSLTFTQTHDLPDGITCKIILEGNPIGGVLVVSDEGQSSDQNSLSTVVECNANEIVYVKVSSGGPLWGGGPFTIFSGVLITPL